VLFGLKLRVLSSVSRKSGTMTATVKGSKRTDTR